MSAQESECESDYITESSIEVIEAAETLDSILSTTTNTTTDCDETKDATPEWLNSPIPTAGKPPTDPDYRCSPLLVPEKQPEPEPPQATSPIYISDSSTENEDYEPITLDFSQVDLSHLNELPKAPLFDFYHGDLPAETIEEAAEQIKKIGGYHRRLKIQTNINRIKSFIQQHIIQYYNADKFKVAESLIKKIDKIKCAREAKATLKLFDKELKNNAFNMNYNQEAGQRVYEYLECIRITYQNTEIAMDLKKYQFH